MRVYRSLTLFVVISLTFVASLRWWRSHQHHHADKTTVLAEKGLPQHPVVQEGGLEVPAHTPVADLLAGAEDYLWIEDGVVRDLKEVPILVDPWVHRLLLSATGATHKCQLSVASPGPDAAAVLRSYELPSGVLIAIDNPPPGRWNLQAKGKDDILIFARAVSQAGFDSLDFPGDPMLVPGKTVQAQAHLSAPEIARAEFRVYGKDGTLIQNIPPAPPASVGRAPMPDRRQYEYRFSFAVPPTSFRIGMVGQDGKGQVFQRVYAKVFESQEK